MTSDLRKTWRDAKKKASGHVPRDFFNHEDFGPKLDSYEKAYGTYEKEKDPDKEDKLRKKAYDAGVSAFKAGQVYLKNVHNAVSANKDNRDLHKALYGLETTLAMKILHPLERDVKRLK